MDSSKSIQQFFLPLLVVNLTIVLGLLWIVGFATFKTSTIETEYRNLEFAASILTSSSRYLSDPTAIDEIEIPETRTVLFTGDLKPLNESDTDAKSLLDRTLTEISDNSIFYRSIATPLDRDEDFFLSAILESEGELYHLLLVRSSAPVVTYVRRVFWISSTALVLALLFLTLISYRIVRTIVAPIKELERISRAIGAGEFERRASIKEPQELKSLSDSMNLMALQLQQNIRTMESRQSELTALLSGMSEGLILVDTESRIRRMNDAARRFFPSNTIPIGRLLIDVTRNADLEEYARRVLEEEMEIEETISLYRDDPIQLRINVNPVQLQDERMVLLVLRDVTQLRRLETIRRDFVANVSHELKTPITSIQGFVETILDGGLEDREEAERFLYIISKQSRRLHAIIEDLLQLSRLEQAGTSPDLTWIQINTVIEAVRSLLDTKAHERMITLVESHSGDPSVMVNQSLLERAIMNLLDNAITYIPPEGTVTIRTVRSENELTITITDDGPGISLPDQERIFERFYRVDRARSQALGGTGLGLAIVKHIALTHGGTVSLESIPGKGSSFSIIIPQPPPEKTVLIDAKLFQ